MLGAENKQDFTPLIAYWATFEVPLMMIQFSYTLSGVWGELLLDFAGLQGDVSRQAAFHRRLHFSFDQRLCVLYEFLVRHESIFTDPIARNEMLHVGNVPERLQIGAPANRTIAALPNDFHHETA